MADRIRPLKMETPTRGTETDEFPTGLDPSEDHIEARGFFLQNDSSDDESVHITRDASNRITFKDSEITVDTTLRAIRTAQNLYTGAETAGKTLQTDGASGIQLADVVSGYPPAFDTLFDATIDTTTLSTWENKLSLTTPSLETGSYIIIAQANISGSKSNTQMSVQAQWDNTDTFGTLNAIAGLADSETQFTAHTIEASVSGVHTIDIDFKKAGGSGYVSIREARITYWRVSAT